MKGIQSIATLMGLAALSIFGLMASYPIWTISEEPGKFACGVVYDPSPGETLAWPGGHMGRALFESNCTVCHAINEQVVGPALKDAHLRMDSVMLRNWIMNSQKVIQSGDEYAVSLYNTYNKTEMPSYAFSDEELTQLIEYIKAASVEQVFTPDMDTEVIIAD